MESRLHDDYSLKSTLSPDSSTSTQIQILIMSQAGKPIFSTSGDAESLAKMCGLIQAIRISVMDPKSNLGDIQMLKTTRNDMVFMSVGSLTLVAISDSQSTIAHLKLQLEYMYSHIIFTMTNQVQAVFAQSPGYDLDISDSAFQHVFNDVSVTAPQNCLTGGAQVVGPFSAKLRENCSNILHTVGKKTPNTVFALLLVGNKILTIVQPSYRPHQLKSSDLQLIIQFVHHQPGVLTSELWFPVCLPRFNASGFLYAYTKCFDKTKKLSLVLISQINTTQQFEEFRQASIRIRCELDIPEEQGSILRITAHTESQSTSHFDVEWKRSSNDSRSRSGGVTLEPEGETRKLPPVKESGFILKELRRALDEKAFLSRMEEYCSFADVIHFVYRLDVPIKSDGILTQCISAPLLDVPFVDNRSKQRVWNMYERLCLRMRIGTCTTEATMDVLDNLEPLDHENVAGIGALCCPAMRLLENPASVHGISYILDGLDLFLVMNGRDFELYLVLSSTVPIKKAALSGAKLARRLFADEQKLFLMRPLVWKD